MAFEMQTRQAGDLTIVALSGRLTIGAASTVLHERVEKLIEEGHRNVVLDLHNTDYVDSAGLGAMVTSLTCARSRGGTLRLTNVPKRIQALLDVSSLNVVFQIIEVAEAAAEKSTDAS